MISRLDAQWAHHLVFSMTERWPFIARLKRWIGNATIGLGAVAVLLTAVAGVAALVLVFGAAARLLIGWWQYYPK